jgi:hypothetical protein
MVIHLVNPQGHPDFFVYPDAITDSLYALSVFYRAGELLVGATTIAYATSDSGESQLISIVFAQKMEDAESYLCIRQDDHSW